MRGPLSAVLLFCLACQPGQPDAAAGAEANETASAAATSTSGSASRIQDPDVRRIHERMMAAMGGHDAWERARYLEFDWIVMRGQEEAVRRTHHWDRYTGDYSVRASREDGQVVAIFNIGDALQGDVWIDGEPVEGPAADSLLNSAHAWHINDSYWLIMPYKWTDPGVNLTYEGTEETDGRTWEKVRLSFDQGTGLTPQNQYLAMIDRESGLMERWHHYRTADADPLVTEWTDWREFGPIRLATDKPGLDGQGGIRFENITVATEVPEDAFQPPT